MRIGSKKEVLKKIVLFLLIQVLFLLFLEKLVNNGTIRYYDETTQHLNFVKNSLFLEEISGRNLLNKFILTTKYIGRSVMYEEYNCVSTFPLSLVSNLFSLNIENRWSFVLLIYVFYLLPCFWFFYQLIGRLSEKLDLKKSAMVMVLFFTNGFLMICMANAQTVLDGLLLILIMLNLRSGWIKNKLKLTIISALLLGILPILHRWYLFFVVTVLIVDLVLDIVDLVRKKKKRNEVVYLNLIKIGITVLVFRLLSGDLWKKYFLVDYANLYSVFKTSWGFWWSAHETFRQIGYVFVLVLFAAIWFLIKKDKKYWWYPLMFLGQSFLFLRIQNFSPHHLLLLFVPIFVPITVFLIEKKSKNFFWLVLLLNLINMVGLFCIDLSKYKLANYFSSVRYIHLSKNETQIREMAMYLQGMDDVKKVYFTTNHFFYNSSVLAYYVGALDRKYADLYPKIVNVPVLIEAKEYPIEFEESNYFLISNFERNKAVTLFSNFVRTSDNFEKLDKIFVDNSLSGGEIKVEVYRLKKELSDKDKEYLRREYNKYKQTI